MRKDEFPSREEFYERIMKLKMQREKKREGIYLGYLKEQKSRRKPRSSKNAAKDKDERRY